MAMVLRWSAWKGGGAIGLKVPIPDRDAYFDRTWSSVILHIPSDTGSLVVEVNIDKSSFWNDTCHELISKHIKKWLVSLGRVPWPWRQPPKVLVEALGGRAFAILGTEKRDADS
jgi:hypothetical protein